MSIVTGEFRKACYYRVHLTLQDSSGLHEHVLQLKRPGEKIVKFAVHLGDEVVQTTMCLFYPDMFGLKGKHLVKVRSIFIKIDKISSYFYLH